MSNTGTGIESVWGFEDGEWQIYSPDRPDISNLSTMKTGKGYWVKTSKGGLSIQIQGQVSPVSLDLQSGWNLIGFSSLQRVSVEEALAGMNYQILWGFTYGDWQVYDLMNIEISDLVNFETGRGYWLYK